MTDEIQLPLDLVLRLVLKPGQAVGGEVRAVESEFSGPDGVMLDVQLGQPAVPLGGQARLALSENQPDPFSNRTSFTVTLEAAAEVEVGVYDITGRRVAVLHHGWLPVGSHPLSWDGRSAEGAAAPNGIYFYRAVSGGQAVARKMALLRGN